LTLILSVWQITCNVDNGGVLEGVGVEEAGL